MKLFKQGDKSKAICPTCGLVSTTFQYRDVPLSSGNGVVNDILVGVCDHCDTVVSTPPQSTPKIKEARQRIFKSLEASLPAFYMEILDAACYLVQPQIPNNLFKKTLLTHYINKLATNDAKHKGMIARLKDHIRQSKKDESSKKIRLSMKLSEEISQDFEMLVKEVDADKTSLLKSIIYLIKDEIVEKESKTVIKQIQSISKVVHA